jgi:hypothetical protein
MMLNASPSIGPLPSTFSEAVRVQAAGRQPILFEDLSSEAKSTALKYVFDDEAPMEWSEEDVVLLHWRLLQELGGLGDPDTPLDEKLDTLRWVFTDPKCEREPFSFVNCLRVVSLSPLSPVPFVGPIDAESIRDWIRYHVRKWLTATIDRYPSWAAEAVLENPCWIESRLAKNPQWINEEIKKHTEQGDLFA